jgi:tetratricopeptide (TPR) repeat protein
VFRIKGDAWAPLYRRHFSGKNDNLSELADAASWQRHYGLFVAAGPAFVRDALVHDVTLLDVVPLVLACLGIPPARDMEGRIPHAVFRDPVECSLVPTWEEAGPGPSHARTLDEKWIEAIALLDGSRVEHSARLLWEIYQAHPENVKYGQTLALALLRLGVRDLAHEVIDSLACCRKGLLPHYLLKTILLRQRRETADARRCLEKAEELAGKNVVVLSQIAGLWFSLRQWRRSRAAYERALAIDPSAPGVQAGLSCCLAQLNQFDDAIVLARKSLALIYQNPYGHFATGLVAAHQGNLESAMRSFETTVRLAPAFRPAYHYLRYIYRKLGETEKLRVLNLTLAARAQEALRHRLAAAQVAARIIRK